MHRNAAPLSVTIALTATRSCSSAITISEIEDFRRHLCRAGWPPAGCARHAQCSTDGFLFAPEYALARFNRGSNMPSAHFALALIADSIFGSYVTVTGTGWTLYQTEKTCTIARQEPGGVIIGVTAVPGKPHGAAIQLANRAWKSLLSKSSTEIEIRNVDGIIATTKEADVSQVDGLPLITIGIKRSTLTTVFKYRLGMAFNTGPDGTKVLIPMVSTDPAAIDILERCVLGKQDPFAD